MAVIDDLKYGMRMLARRPGFTAIAVITLALGVGANTAAFSIVNALLLRPYPFPDLDRLVLVRESGPKVLSEQRVAPADFLDMQREVAGFEGLSAFRYRFASLLAPDGTSSIIACAVSGGFFQTIGAEPLLGRVFTRDEGEPGKGHAAIVNYRYWQEHFAGDPAVLGRSVKIDGLDIPIVGVMPANYNYPLAADFWLPLEISPKERAERDAQARGGYAFQVVGRLRRGVSLAHADSELSSFAARLERLYPATHQDRRMRLLRLREEQYGFAGPPFLMLQAAALFVLALAWANIFNMLLARLLGRRKELAIRTAMGAGQRRLAWLLLAETAPLAAIAGALALACSSWTVNLIRNSIATSYTDFVAGWSGIRVDGRVTIFGLALTAAMTLLFGLGSAWRIGSYDVNEALKESGGRSSTGVGGSRLRDALVAVQVVFATVLLIGAGLMLKGFFGLTDVYGALDPARVLALRVSLPEGQYVQDADVRSFYQQFLHEVAALPGVESAGMVTNAPASNVDNRRTLFTIEGRALLQPGDAPSADVQSASAGLFRSLRIPVLEGRAPGDRDGSEAPRTAAISRTMARIFWPKGDAVGQRIRLGGGDSTAPWTTVTGIVGDVKQNWWDAAPRPVIYLSYLQAPQRNMQVLVRAASRPASLAGGIRQIARALDQAIPLQGVKSLDLEVSESLAPLRILGILMLVFGAISLVLSALGIYGVLAHSVAQRSQEIGIRMALGAERIDLLRLVLRRAWKLAGFGVAIGALLALAATRILAGVLYGIIAFDAPVFAGLACLLMAIASVAAYLPARHAAAVDPVLALRNE